MHSSLPVVQFRVCHDTQLLTATVLWYWMVFHVFLAVFLQSEYVGANIGHGGVNATIRGSARGPSTESVAAWFSSRIYYKEDQWDQDPTDPTFAKAHGDHSNPLEVFRFKLNY